jgi:hypothetical protein
MKRKKHDADKILATCCRRRNEGVPALQILSEPFWAGLFGWFGDLLRGIYRGSKGVAAIRPSAIIVFAGTDAVRVVHVVKFLGLLGAVRRLQLGWLWKACGPA